jgi:restriction system protein
MMPPTKVSGQTAFVLKIVQVLRDMNGIGKASAVKNAIAAEAAEAGKNLDETELSTGAVKWENDVHWARMHLVNAGVLEPRATAGTGKLEANGRGLASAVDG